jgi:ribonuclease Y
MKMLTIILTIVISLAAGAGAALVIKEKKDSARLKTASSDAKTIVDNAKKEAQEQKRLKLLEAENEAHKKRSEWERETKQRNSELQRLERRLIQREENLERKLEGIEQKEKLLQEKEKEASRIKEELQQIKLQEIQKLETIAGVTADEAKSLLLKSLDNEIKHEKALLIRKAEQDTKQEIESRTREIIVNAIQRYTADHTAETTVSIVPLPNDEMKGRIIGKEGRNVRVLEMLTGVDLIIDDTPETVVVSAFDPVRREIARLTLEKLIQDGRIHPARIEEMVAKAQKEVENRIKEAGESACLETGITGLHPDLVKLLGQLRYRTSYSQNVLKHSIEVAFMAATIAAELGINVEKAKRAGLLHDIGKAVSAEVEGPHAVIGGNILTKYNEDPDVIHGVAGHHYDEEPRNAFPILIATCDAISASRPGARRETVEKYLKRLEKLEKVANSFEGIEKCFAIQAGREIRIIVKPDKINDDAAWELARNVSKKIQDEMEYPGQIKVTVIRETRAIEYAK